MVQNQYAFGKVHSTITSLIKSSDDWLVNIDSNKGELNIIFGL